MHETTFTGRLRKQGAPSEAIDVELAVEGPALTVWLGEKELGRWPVSQVRLVRARVLVEFGTEAWWFEPDDSSVFIEHSASLFGSSAGRRGRSKVYPMAALARAVRGAARFWREWRRSSSGSDAAIVVGGLATIGVATMVGSGVAALLGAWGAGIATYAVARVVLRMRMARHRILDITPTGGTEAKTVGGPARSGLPGAEDEFARLFGESLRNRNESPRASSMDGGRATAAGERGKDRPVARKIDQSGD